MRYYLSLLIPVYALVLGCYLLSGCANEPPAMEADHRVHFVELEGGTCGEPEPVSDLNMICHNLDLDGVASTSLSDDGVWTIQCVAGGMVTFDTKTGTGNFYYYGPLNDGSCESSYGLQYRETVREVSAKKEELRGPFAYYANNFGGGSIECASRTNALKALVRGWFPGCNWTCTSDGANRVCNTQPSCAPPVYLTACSVGATEHCTVGISFLNAGTLAWTAGSRTCGAGWSGTAEISGGSQLFGLQASVTEKWLNP
jgi:hypothetical protein